MKRASGLFVAMLGPFLDPLGGLEVVWELRSTLDPSIANMADLLRVEEFPLFIVELCVEVLDELGMDKIHESIPNITIVLD